MSAVIFSRLYVEILPRPLAEQRYGALHPCLVFDFDPHIGKSAPSNRQILLSQPPFQLVDLTDLAFASAPKLQRATRERLVCVTVEVGLDSAQLNLGPLVVDEAAGVGLGKSQPALEVLDEPLAGGGCEAAAGRAGAVCVAATAT